MNERFFLARPELDTIDANFNRLENAIYDVQANAGKQKELLRRSARMRSTSSRGSCTTTSQRQKDIGVCQYILEGAPEVAKPETKGALAWWAIHGDPFAPHVRPGDSTEQSTARISMRASVVVPTF